MVAAAAPWNKGAGAQSPPRRCSAGRRRRATGVVSSRILGSGEAWCSKGGHRGGGDGGLEEVLSPVSFFILVWLLLASPRGCWGWCGGVLVLGAGFLLRLYRRSSSGISVFVASFWCGGLASLAGHGGVGWRGSVFVLCFNIALILLSPAGRGGEGRRCGQGVLSAAAPASRVRAQCRDGWKRGGCGMEAPWLCAFSDLRFRRLRRTAPAVFYMSGVLPLPGLAAAWCLLLRRCSAM